MTVTTFNEPLLFWHILSFMRLVAVNAAVVPESCAPRDLVWIIRAGLKMDNETFDKYGLWRRDFPCRKSLEFFFPYSLRCQGWMNPCHSLNQLFTDPEDKDAQPVNYRIHSIKNGYTLILEDWSIFRVIPTGLSFQLKNNGNFHHD